MKLCGALILCLCCFAGASRAAPVNLATLTCVSDIKTKSLRRRCPLPGADPINTMMWLFGYSVAKSGAHVMYGDALAGFGFALDAECKNNPTESLAGRARRRSSPTTRIPMDLTGLECETFASRHLDLVQSDRESADTIMMWLYGFAVAKSGSHLFDSSGLQEFRRPRSWPTARKYPGRSLFDELAAVKFSIPKN